MKWLYWKEFWQNRVIVFAMLFIMFVPYIVALIGGWILEEKLQNCVMGAAFYSLILSQLIMALIGGNAFAGERADRSAEFQVYLPIPRIKILAAKLLMALSLMAFIWLTSIAVFLSIIPTKEITAPDFHYALEGLFIIWVIGMVFFGVAWLLSSMINSPVIATCVSIITPLILWSIFYYFGYRHDVRYGYRLADPRMIWRILVTTYIGFCLLLSAISFGIGSWLYLRRVEP